MRRLLPTLLLLSACADVEAEQPVLLGNQGPRIEVFAVAAEEPQLVDFGDVPAGSDAVATLVLRNAGGEPLAIGAVNMSSTDHLDVSDLQGLPARLDPGTEVDFDVRFAPPFDLRLEAAITVWSSDPERPEVSVDVVGDGLAPVLRMDPDDHDFGTQRVGCASEIEVTLENVGRAPLRLGVAHLEEDDLGVTYSLGNWPFEGTELLPGESVAGVVRWRPDDPVPDRAVLVVESDDPHGDRTIVFTGTSVEADPDAACE